MSRTKEKTAAPRSARASRVPRRERAARSLRAAPAIRVLVAEDLEPIRRRYRAILGAEPDIRVVAAVESGRAAVAAALEHRPDVVLMDIEMEDRTAGIRATGEIVRSLPDTKVIMLTVYDADELIFDAYRAGAKDYLLKDTAPAEVVDGVRQAHRNTSPIRPAVAEKVRREIQRLRIQEDRMQYLLSVVSRLTNTEMDVLELMNKGLTRARICETRCIELSTVKTHIHGILRKLDKSAIAEVLAELNEAGFFEALRR